MQALILAGGFGTRLRSVLDPAIPKPMATISGRPFLGYLLAQLRRDGFLDVVLLTGHRAEVVETYFGTGDGWDLTVRYSPEPEPLGTGGALRHALPLLAGERFLVMNGDSFLGTDLNQLTAAHDRAAAAAGDGVLATLALARLADGSRFGSVDVAPDGSLTGFREKAQPAAPGLINAGIYVLERRLIEAIPLGRAVSLEREVFPTLLDGRLRGVELEGPFVDIGVPESYAALEADPSILPVAGAGGRS